MLISLFAFLVGAAGPANYAEMPFDLGPAPVTVDLRNMLREYVVQRSCQALDEMAARRRQAFDSGQWQAFRGWADTSPANLPYDIAGWAGTDRWLAYVTAALDDPVFAMRVRDGLAAIEYLRSRPEINGSRIVIGGHGMGGVVALHVAAIDAQLKPGHAPCPVFMNRPLASFEVLATSQANAWPHDCYVPGVLMRYDLPELAGELAAPVLVVNPLGGDAKPLDNDTIDGIYPRTEHLTVRAGLAEDAAHAAVLDFIKKSTAR